MTVTKQAWWQRTAMRVLLLLLVFSVGAVLAVRLFERMLLDEVQAVTEEANVAFIRVFVNESWSELRPVLDLEAKAHPRENPNLREIDQRVRQFAKGTDLVKVKIYNPKGLTVYSSDAAQLGEDKAANVGFQAAIRGRVASETTYRGKFGAFDGELYQRNLVSSYVPVRGVQGVEAVAEIYTDRTGSIEGVTAKLRQAWLYFGGGMSLAFVLVWALMQVGRGGGHTPQADETTAAPTPTPSAGDATPWLGEAVRALGDNARPLAHTLKGVAATLGAIAISERAAAVENALYEGRQRSQITPLVELLADPLARMMHALREQLGLPSSAEAELAEAGVGQA